LTAIHEELLASTYFRHEAQERWETVGRWQVFSEVLAAYDAKLYFVAIPPALAQAEGIVGQLFNIESWKQRDLKIKVDALHEDDFDLFGPLVRDVLAGMLGPFDFRVSAYSKLGRNAVLHGADSHYGTRENAIAAIIWADYIMYAANDYKAVAIPKTGDEAADIMAGKR
jgi:hypothetical protein